MKKDYIAHLQEYDARTSFVDKQDKYRRKFIKTCYQHPNKQNIDPNASDSKKQQNHHKNMKPRQITINPFRCEIKENHPNDCLYLINKGGKQTICCDSCSKNHQNRTILFRKHQENDKELTKLQTMRINCVKTGRILEEKLAEEQLKCSEYYRILIDQLKHQELDTLSHIRQYFQRSFQQIQEVSQAIEDQIQRLRDSSYQYQAKKNISYSEDLAIIDLQLVSLKVPSSNMLEILKSMQKFHLLSQKSTHSSQQKSNNKSDSDFQCSQQVLVGGCLPIRGAADVSFEVERDWHMREEDLSLKESEEGGISPCFKLF